MTRSCTEASSKANLTNFASNQEQTKENISKSLFKIAEVNTFRRYLTTKPLQEVSKIRTSI
ncbi:MAG: hypothetical protein Q4E81_08265 [Succinatimonas sp.]|nr:hypothetical protein [Succinatimonas sp.]